MSFTIIEKEQAEFMNDQLKQNLKLVNETLEKAEYYEQAARTLNFDMETICPEKGMEREGDVAAFLENEAFQLQKAPAFTDAAEALYAGREELERYDRALAEALHRQYLKTKNRTPEVNHEMTRTYNRAFSVWSKAREASDFQQFLPALTDVLKAQRLDISLREGAKEDLYDNMLDDYERGLTAADLDVCFGRVKERLVPLLQKIMASKKTIRTDFLSRPVTDEQQRIFARYLLTVIGFDFTRGNFTTSEHPFTDGLGPDDARITTHYYPTQLISSMYSIIHEGGHALFEQLQPKESHIHHLTGEKTMGMHESVSRFYENVLGRSRGFIHLIFPEMQRIFAGVLDDVTEEELYEAVNVVSPGLIRTEADEFTYAFHVIIRYELEREIAEGKAELSDLPQLWADRYESYLGIRPASDREGVLQDVHWTFGFGYFPSYCIGNMYNSMYVKEMRKSIDLDRALAEGDFASINTWMAEHVFAKADLLSPKEWIRDITGRALTPDDFLDYLEEKYTALYEL